MPMNASRLATMAGAANRVNWKCSAVTAATLAPTMNPASSAMPPGALCGQQREQRAEEPRGPHEQMAPVADRVEIARFEHQLAFRVSGLS
jgi:hypothetical protein